MQINDIREKTRLGDLLIQKGILTAEQLARAIEEQRRCRQCTIGQVLLDQGHIRREQLDECLREQAHVRLFRQTRLGNLLIDRGYVDKRQLDAAIREQKMQQGQTLGSILVAQGVLSERQLRACLRQQSYLRLSAAVLALSITPFQAAFADREGEEASDARSATIAYELGNLGAATRIGVLHGDLDDVEVYEGGQAVEKMVGVAAKVAWTDWTDATEFRLLDTSTPSPQGYRDMSTYRVGLGSSGLRLSSVSQGQFSTASYKMTLTSSGGVELKYTLQF